VCVYYFRTYYKAVRGGGEESGGHVLWMDSSDVVSVTKVLKLHILERKDSFSQYSNPDSSGKNSRYFHTLGYENIFLQKLDFLHTV